MIEKETTTQVEPFNSSHFGHETFFISTETSEKKFFILFIKKLISNQSQEWQDLNLQPPVLETGALPIELHSYI